MSDRSLADLEGFFLTLSDGTRLRLLSLMRHGEVSVGYLSERLGQSQPKISRHLAYLRAAGLVDTRRDGKWIYYHIAYPNSYIAARLLDDALDWVGGQSNDDVRTEERWRGSEFASANYTEHHTEAVDTENGWNDIEVYLL
jgi:DNA-binding transcriptional ArsR family regulator